MAEDEAAVLAAAKKLSYSERGQHKNWKVRSELYEDIRTACNNASDSSDAVIQQTGSLFSSGVGDTNANVMDKAIDALCAWLQKADENQASREVSGVTSTMAAKCLKARPATVTKAIEACLLFIELEQQATVIENIMKAFDDKVPKVVIAALDTIYKAISDFGSKVVDPKPILKTLPKVYTHSNAGVRDRAKDVTVALAACTGPGLVESTLVEKMNDAMKKDVGSAIAALPSRKKKAERYTRKEQAAMADAPDDVDAGDDGDEHATAAVQEAEPMDIDADPYDYSDPVDILGPLQKAQVTVGDDDPVAFWECFESKKWNVRKAALDKVKDVAKAPRLATGDYGDIVRELKKVLAKDANVNCAASAAEVAGALATGLRKDFYSQGKSLCSSIMERFKEKHTGMSRAADDALRALARYCYTLPDVQDDLTAALSHKNPKVRLDTLRLIKDMADETPKPLVQKSKDMLSAVAKLAGEADPGIREAAQGVLVAFAVRLGGYNTITSYLSKLDDARCKLIESAVAAAPKPGAGSRPAAAAPTAKPISRAASVTSTGSAAASKPPPRALGPRNAATGAAAAASRPKTAAAAPRMAPAPSIEDEAALSVGRLSVEEVDQKMTEWFGSEILEELRSPQWQQRLEAVSVVTDKGQQLVEVDHALCSELIQSVAVLPGWSDKNFQVLNKIFEFVTQLAKSANTFGKREAMIGVEGVSDKIHELKHRIQCCDALNAMSEAVGPRFVAAQLHKRAADNKNPKVLSESLAWIATAVEEFGLVVMDLPAIIEWTIADLGSPNAPVRNQAMAVLGKCHAQVGGGLIGQLEGLKPAQLTAIEEIFRKHPKQNDFEPLRRVRTKTRAAKPATSGAHSGAILHMDDEDDDENQSSMNMEDLLPRQEVGGLLMPLISRINSSNWKERNQAMDSVEQVLNEAGNRIQPAPNEIYPALKGRMTDTNRNLAAKALLLLAKLAAAIGDPFDKQARPALASAIANLSDNKKQVRDAVLVMLDAWVATCTPDKIFPTLAETLCNSKCMVDGRSSGVAWMTKVVASRGAARCLDSATKTAVITATDKSGAVRDAGNALLIQLIQSEGPDGVTSAVNSLDAASKKAAAEVMPKALLNAGMVAPSSAGKGPRPGSGAAAAVGVAAAAAVGAAVAGTRSRSATATTAAEEADPDAILALSTSKAARAKNFRVRVGRFDGFNPDEIETLEAQLGAVASPDFKALLFAKDFKKHVEAADALIAAVPSLLNEITASLDLILRWAVLRICDNNMQSLMRVLEACRVILEALAAEGYKLTDTEVLVLLPGIVEKWGHNQDRVRSLHRQVIHIACTMHPTARVLEHITLGLGSKNVRTRVECCDEIAAIVDREGPGPVASCRAKPMAALALLLKERDGSIRSAALNAIEAVSSHAGVDATWKMLGRLDTRERDMVDEKLKRSTRTAPNIYAPPAIAATAAVAAEAMTPPPQPNSAANSFSFGAAPGQHDDSVRELEYSRPAFTPPNALDSPTSRSPPSSNEGLGLYTTAAVPLPSIPPAMASVVQTPVPSKRPISNTSSATSSPNDIPDDPRFNQRWTQNMTVVTAPLNSIPLPEVIETMKQLCTDIMLATSGRLSTRDRALMGASAEQLIAGVNRQLTLIFASAQQEAALTGERPSSRGCKYALNVMLQGMSVPEIAQGLSQATLRDSVSLLLLRLLDDGGLMQFDEGATLVKAVNVLMLKILESGNKTYCFAALLHLLRDPPRAVSAEQEPKFYDLVVKCLIKLTKGLQQSTEGVDMAALLFSLHDFFMFLGVDEIRKRSSSDDKPLRMVKTVLHELCKLKGYGIYNYTAGIPGRNATPQPIIFAYIQLNLTSLQQSGIIQPPAAGVELGPSTANGGATKAEKAQGAAIIHAHEAQRQALKDAQKAEVKARLKLIMTRLVKRDKAVQDEAMVDLYRLRQEHKPYVDRYIAGTSDMFRQFIDSGLARLEASGGVPASPATPEGGTVAEVGPSPASVRSDSSARISGLRDRLSSFRLSTEGGGAVSGTSSPVVPSPKPRPVSAEAGRLSVEQLAARMQSLKRSGQALLNKPVEEEQS